MGRERRTEGKKKSRAIPLRGELVAFHLLSHKQEFGHVDFTGIDVLDVRIGLKKIKLSSPTHEKGKEEKKD
jgi:hypothetical protein